MTHFLFSLNENSSSFTAKKGRINHIFKELLINDQITATEVRLVAENGEQKGIMPYSAALSMAQNQDLDLVMISPTANPPVCKIMNYSKFRYEQKKKEKEENLAARRKAVELKTLRLSMVAEEHDVNILARKAIQFLKDGNKIKLDMMVKGRHNIYSDRGIEICKNFAEMVKEYGTPEKMPEKTGKFINMIIAPNKNTSTKKEN